MPGMIAPCAAADGSTRHRHPAIEPMPWPSEPVIQPIGAPVLTSGRSQSCSHPCIWPICDVWVYLMS